MVYYNVVIEETGESFRCSPQESLLVGMERLGKKGIPVGCRGGGCGVCKIEITEGTYQKRVMSREYVSARGRSSRTRTRLPHQADQRYPPARAGKMCKNLCRPQQPRWLVLSLAV
jgi:ferredoxin